MQQPQKPALLSFFRRAVQYELFQDFQDVIYSRLKRPSVVLIRQSRNSLRPCFPRKRRPLPNEFFHFLLDIAQPRQLYDILEEDEINFALAGLAAEEKGEHWDWGWRSTSLGLCDLYLPIRLQPEDSSGDSIVAVLIAGKLRVAAASSQAAYNWIYTITRGDTWERYFPNTTPEQRQTYESQLKSLFDEIPIADARIQSVIEQHLTTITSLLQTILSRLIYANRGDQFIHNLGLGQPSIHITEQELWSIVEKALNTIIQQLDLATAVLYASSYSDYTDMKCRIKIGRSIEKIPEVVGLASYSEFEWLQNQEWTLIPKQGANLAWIEARIYFGSDSAMLFAAEMIGGHLVLLGFGIEPDAKLNLFQRTILYEAVTARVFRFIENALFRVELDELLAETGHLMGRAIGKVKSGADVIAELLPTEILKPQNEELVESARWALDDGLMRLELIRQNFYSFGSRRHAIETGLIDDGADINEQRYCVDVVATLGAMQSFFERAVRESKLKPIRYMCAAETAPTLGREGDLKLVFLNVFDNALKFAYSNTFITISLLIEDDTCVVSFMNLGIGVANDESERVFRRLARSRFKDPAKRIEGLGLGLSYCKRIVEEIFHGTIALESRQASTPSPRRFEGDNWLTTVTIELPLIRRLSGKQ